MELCLYTRTDEIAEAHVKGSLVVMVDVLRASSTIVQAWENGVERVIPVADVEDATRLLQTLERKKSLLGGEREGKKIEGFDLGNSPLEYAGKAVRKKTLILSTTNGTSAITLSGAAKEIVIGCFLNISAVVKYIVASRSKRVVVLCAGNSGQLALEDFVCGGQIVERLGRSSRARLDLNDGAVAARATASSMSDVGEVIRESSHGRRLAELGFEQDLEFCAHIDKYNSVPIVIEGRITGDDQRPR
ncbi:MAG: 2-phosphosulfolactate phosphatase family protein [Candidatus Eisenbacteria bacterium]|nr:2-phosphosulfolactate phosphatase family protein [Candidatus Eisenbacteria bacterium]